MQQQLRVKNNWDEKYEDVSIVFWCLWNGCCHTPLTRGFSPPVSRKPMATDASDLQYKPACMCVCLFTEVSTAYLLCLSVWMNCLHTLKSMWLIVSASVFFIQKIQTTKKICSCMCVFERTCVCMHVYILAPVCVARPHAEGLLLSLKARLYLGDWFSLSCSPSEWLRALPTDWERLTTGICCLCVWPPDFQITICGRIQTDEDISGG